MSQHFLGRRINTPRSAFFLLLVMGSFLWQGCSPRQPSATLAPEQQPDVPSQPVSNQCSNKKLVKQPGSNVFGVIEIGSSGVKAEVLQKLKEPNEHGYLMEPRDEEVEAEDVNPINPNAKAQTVAAVKATFEQLQNRFTIPCEHIVIYGSSGFAGKADPNHKAQLMQAIEAELGREVDIITPDQEATYTFNAVVPEHRLDQVLLVDVGSGNTKGAFLNAGKKQTFSVPWGTKSFTTQIDTERQSQGFATVAARLKSTLISPAIQQAEVKTPTIHTNSRVYLSGGIAWALATLVQPCQIDQEVDQNQERVSRFTELKQGDIEAFYQRVNQSPQRLFSPDLSSCKQEQKERAQKDIQRIREKVFTQDELIAGSELLRALSTRLNFGSKDAIFFSRYAFEGLPIGYLKAQLDQQAS